MTVLNKQQSQHLLDILQEEKKASMGWEHDQLIQGLIDGITIDMNNMNEELKSTESTAEGQFGTPEMAERWKRVYYGHLASGNSLWDLLESLVDEKAIWDFYVKVQRDMATDKDVLQWVLDWESIGDDVFVKGGKSLYG